MVLKNTEKAQAATAPDDKPLTRLFNDEELKELFAGNGMVGFVMKERVDGKLVLPEAVQTLKIKGTDKG